MKAPTGWQADVFFGDLMSVFLKIKTLMHDEVDRRGLSMSHFLALRLLHAEGTCKMSRLTEVLELTHGAGTGITDRLVRDGLVERTSSADDRRVVHVTLTPAGTKLLADLIATVQSQFQAIVEELKPDDREQVAQGLHLLADAIRSRSDGEIMTCHN